MNSIILKLFVLTLCFFAINMDEASSQTIKELDSLAFYALENNLPSVSEKANELTKASYDKDQLFHKANGHTILGIVNKNKGYYITAINHYLKALNISEEIGDKGRRSACLNNIGAIYLLQENYSEALKHFNNSLELEKTLNQPIQKSIRYYNIGDVYNQIDSLELALSFYTNSLIIEKKEKNTEGIVYANLGLSEVYIKAKQFNDAKSTLLKTVDLIDDTALEEQIIYLRLESRLFELEGDLDKSSLNLSRAIKIAKDNNLQSAIPQLLKNQIRIIEKQENWKLSHSKYKELTLLSENLNSVKVKNQLADLSFQNELNKKDLELQLVKEERDLAAQTAEHEKNIRQLSTKITWFLVFSILLIIALLVLGFKKFSNN